MAKEEFMNNEVMIGWSQLPLSPCDLEILEARRATLASYAPEANDGRFGQCPLCATAPEVSEYLNIGSNHWFICRTHRVKWWPGSNLLSSWREQSGEKVLVTLTDEEMLAVGFRRM